MKIFKTLKKYTAHMLATGFTITLAACYGPNDELVENYTISGRVLDSVENSGIEGIEVCAVQESYEICGYTNSSGNFLLYPDPNIRYDSYEVCAEDVDDATHGTYEKKCVSVTDYNYGPVVDFQLDSTNLKDNFQE